MFVFKYFKKRVGGTGEQNILDTKKDFDWVDYDKNGFIDAQELRNSTPSMEEDDVSFFFWETDR